jgi:uncharacterized protein (TIGR00255 family)
MTDPVRSMTGFAEVRRQTSAGQLTISLRSVNHRGLDLHFHLGGDFAPFENAMRARLKQRVARGHVEVRMSLNREPEAQEANYNYETLARYVAAFRRAAVDFQLASDPDLNVLLGLPGVLEPSRDAANLAEAFEPELLGALEECIALLNTHREREGSALLAGLEPEIAAIESRTKQIAGLRDQAIPYFLQRLRERLAELLAGSAIPENRLVEEAALLADRSDVQEELTRLTVHTEELCRILAKGGEVGKRLDFLLQEMNRETNTILSKSSGSGDPGLEITNAALGIKANIERIREQALNLE